MNDINNNVVNHEIVHAFQVSRKKCAMTMMPEMKCTQKFEKEQERERKK